MGEVGSGKKRLLTAVLSLALEGTLAGCGSAAPAPGQGRQAELPWRCFVIRLPIRTWSGCTERGFTFFRIRTAGCKQILLGKGTR